MPIGSAAQFGSSCLIVDGENVTADVETLLEIATEEGAIVDDGEDYHFVVQFPGQRPELYTEYNFRREFERFQRSQALALAMA